MKKLTPLRAFGQSKDCLIEFKLTPIYEEGGLRGGGSDAPKVEKLANEG